MQGLEPNPTKKGCNWGGHYGHNRRARRTNPAVPQAEPYDDLSRWKCSSELSAWTTRLTAERAQRAMATFAGCAPPVSSFSPSCSCKSRLATRDVLTIRCSITGSQVSHFFPAAPPPSARSSFRSASDSFALLLRLPIVGYALGLRWLPDPVLERRSKLWDV